MIMLKDKVALVTGAGRGLGRAHALALASAGATIVVNDLGGAPDGDGADQGPAAEVVAEIRAMGGQAMADTRSVADWATARAIVDDAVQTFGRLDIVVNNAGISRPTRFGAIAAEDWRLTFDVNAMGTAAIIDAAARHWLAVGPDAGRAIINTASPAAAATLAPIGLYSASKAAVVALTEAAAEDLAPLGVRVNAIAPVARTRLIDGVPEMVDFMAARPGFDRFDPAHVSAVVVFLASPLCRFTARLIGAEGDTIYLYDQRSAEVRLHNDGVAWTPDALARTLEAQPLQQESWAVFPGDRIRFRVPGDSAVAALDGAAT
jgi:NAD(P)-dependent dehydrogenase (short-subunit alcohol dehydrogenase family)